MTRCSLLVEVPRNHSEFHPLLARALLGRGLGLGHGGEQVLQLLRMSHNGPRMSHNVSLLRYDVGDVSNRTPVPYQGGRQYPRLCVLLSHGATGPSSKMLRKCFNCLDSGRGGDSVRTENRE